MTRLAAVLTAAMLVLAGCTGAPSFGGAGDSEAENGAVNFYVSDETNAIDDFEHLNVTITKVGLHRANATNESVNATNESANATESGWVTRDVDNVTLDLTELKGQNATVLTQLNVSEGTYDKAFIYVSEVNGTLKDGNTTDVKLPSNRLHVNKGFTVGSNETVDFVYDVTVVKRGQSGSYNIRPVVGESGTDVPIKEIERDGAGLGARFVGDVQRGGSATVKVTQEGQPVAGANVTVNGESYRTGGDGTVTFDVPSDVAELEVRVEYQGSETELKRKFADSGGGAGERGDTETQSRLAPV